MKKFWLISLIVMLFGFVACTLDKPGDVGPSSNSTNIIIMPNATNLISTSSNYVESLGNSVAILFQSGWNTNSDYLRGLWVRNVTEFYDIFNVTDTTNYIGTVTNVWGIYDIFTNLTSEFTNVDIGTTNVDFTYQTTNWVSQTVSDYTNVYAWATTNANAVPGNPTITTETGDYWGQDKVFNGNSYEWKWRGHPYYYSAWYRSSKYYNIKKSVVTTTTTTTISNFSTTDIYDPSDVIINTTTIDVGSPDVSVETSTVTTYIITQK